MMVSGRKLAWCGGQSTPCGRQPGPAPSEPHPLLTQQRLGPPGSPVGGQCDTCIQRAQELCQLGMRTNSSCITLLVPPHVPRAPEGNQPSPLLQLSPTQSNTMGRNVMCHTLQPCVLYTCSMFSHLMSAGARSSAFVMGSLQGSPSQGLPQNLMLL